MYYAVKKSFGTIQLRILFLSNFQFFSLKYKPIKRNLMNVCFSVIKITYITVIEKIWYENFSTLCSYKMQCAKLLSKSIFCNPRNSNESKFTT